ncbi:MAG: NADH-quinone oxidoreductase subunit J [Candidatus Bathyarchaeota archaeon]|nr:NADH-quinone oxidoreductase subunit J [Candidatus Bathyarchaeota archaeon]
MLLELVSAGVVIAACLAIFLDEAVYSVAALAGALMLTSLLYALNGAIYVAVFQFAVGIGTVAVLFLSGETLSEKPSTKTQPRQLIVLSVLGALLSLPAFFLSVSQQNGSTYSVPFGEALWSYRALDVVLQGLVVMTVALGIAIVLYRKKKISKGV